MPPEASCGVVREVGTSCIPGITADEGVLLSRRDIAVTITSVLEYGAAAGAAARGQLRRHAQAGSSFLLHPPYYPSAKFVFCIYGRRSRALL